MAYTRTYTIDSSPGGDTVKAAVATKLDGDLTTIFANLTSHEAMTTNAHGVGAGTICGTTLTQTLTNKTLSSPTITGTVDTSGATMTATKANNLKDVTAGEWILFSTVSSHSTASTTYAKMQEIKVSRAGTYTCKFSLSGHIDEGSYTVYGRLYKNGSAVGTERTTSSPGGTTSSEDVVLAIGDLIQVYAKAAGDMGSIATVPFLYLCCAEEGVLYS